MLGFTTTIPLEIVVAAGRRPLDLNNLFITDPDPQALIETAELAGFPRSTCGWIKGIYGAVRKHQVRELIAVTEGDCSNTKALMEVLTLEGVTTHPFAYPYDRSEAALAGEIDRLCARLGVDRRQVAAAKARLDAIRAGVHEIDRLTWEEDRVHGGENHRFLVSTSDMNGDPEGFALEVEAFLPAARQRRPLPAGLRLAFIGVPPIVTDLYDAIEACGARVVFNETQRQFAMPYPTADLVEQYRRYTYPYDIFTRLEDIESELQRRRIDGVIHYVQSFCFRQIEDLIVRQRLRCPVLTLEGDRPGPLDARTRIRLEGFLDMLRGRAA